MGFVRQLTGKDQAKAAVRAGELQAAGAAAGQEEIARSREEALGFLQPFQQVGEQGLEGAGFLTDPTAQFDFLQQNPLFQLALEQAQTGTQNIAAARGRLSAGDTLQQLSKNVLLEASPLISQQKGSILDLLRMGTGVAGSQANITTGAGVNIADLIGSEAASRAAGTVGAAQAKGGAAANLFNLGTNALFAGLTGLPPGIPGGEQVAGDAFLPGELALSDKRLKSNLEKIGNINGHNIYSWSWNALAKSLFGLIGNSSGVIAQEVEELVSDAITDNNGYLMVDYEMIGVPMGSISWQ